MYEDVFVTVTALVQLQILFLNFLLHWELNWAGGTKFGTGDFCWCWILVPDFKILEF